MTKRLLLASLILLAWVPGLRGMGTTEQGGNEPVMPMHQNGPQNPFITKGKAWLAVNHENNAYKDIWSYYMDGDTVIASRPCVRVMEQRIVPQDAQPSYLCAICEEDGKVWRFAKGGTTPELLYDFRAEAGDEVVMKEGVWLEGSGYWGREVLTVTRVDSVEAGGRLFRRQYVSDGKGQPADIWIEGVGGRNLFCHHGWPDTNYILACLVDGEELFAESDFTREEEEAPYHRLLAVGKKWNESYTDACDHRYDHDFDYEVKGDTLIAGVRHYKLFAHNLEGKGGETMLGLLIEADRHVFSVWTGQENAPNILLYDFDNQPDGKMALYYPMDVRTFDCDEIAYGGGTLRRQAMGYKAYGTVSEWNPVRQPQDWWVEGFGSSADFIRPYCWTPARKYRLESCTLNGDTLFTYADFRIPETAVPDMPEAPYHPLLAEGKSWLYHYSRGHSDPETGEVDRTEYDVTYTLRGDTAIDGRTYMKLYEQHEGKNVYHSAWREEGRKVYMAEPGVPERLFYDYGMPYLGQVPFTSHTSELEPAYLAAKEVIMAGGQYHTRHLLVTDMFEEQTFLVDGVGCHNGILHPSLAYNYYTDLWSFVSCTTPGGETVTAADISSEAVEYNGCNPEIVATPRLKNNTLIHDLQGRRLNGIPQKGVYIQNGRKYVR